MKSSVQLSAGLFYSRKMLLTIVNILHAIIYKSDKESDAWNTYISYAF